MASLPSGGSMLACKGPIGTIISILHQESYVSLEDVQIAGLNSPDQTILSGEKQQLEQCQSKLKMAGIKSIVLKVSHAFHSNLMLPIIPEFFDRMRTLQPSWPSNMPKLILNIDGSLASPNTMPEDYWCQHILRPVAFEPCIQHAYDLGVRYFVEVGPQPILTGLAKKCLSTKDDCQYYAGIHKKNTLTHFLHTQGMLESTDF